jgi:uncharacterized protein (TIGR01777 family)
MKRIMLAGGSGFLGRLLAGHFLKAGWEVISLTRQTGLSMKGVRQIIWDGTSCDAWWKELEGAIAVVNLCGKSVNCRYTAQNRREIMDSRVDSTQACGRAIARCANPPRVWLNASTATIYKHSLGRAMDEDGEIGPSREAKDTFSVEVATSWEHAMESVSLPGVRKVSLRTAMVLGLDANSVFPTLRRLVRFGLGGKMGSGKQFVSWIHETDFCRAVEWLITNETLHGPINLASPNPITNAEMMKLLRKVIAVPIGLPATNWMLEIGAFFLRTETELIIKSRKVIPRRLLESGFQFRFPQIEGAFIDLNDPLS